MYDTHLQRGADLNNFKKKAIDEFSSRILEPRPPTKALLVVQIAFKGTKLCAIVNADKRRERIEEETVFQVANRHCPTRTWSTSGEDERLRTLRELMHYYLSK